jgi:hypothetical protein
MLPWNLMASGGTITVGTEIQAVAGLPIVNVLIGTNIEAPNTAFTSA